LLSELLSVKLNTILKNPEFGDKRQS